jgi:hypothetical protein
MGAHAFLSDLRHFKLPIMIPFSMNFGSKSLVTHIMNVRAIELREIKRDLAKLPPDKLGEVKDFVRRMLPSASLKPKTESLEGMWKGQGWENLTNLEEEIRALRDEAGQHILDKFDRCNS